MSAKNLSNHKAAIESVREALGDQWDALFQEGRNVPSIQILDIACDELQTID